MVKHDADSLAWSLQDNFGILSDYKFPITQ